MFEGLNLARKYNQNLRSQWWWAKVFMFFIIMCIVLLSYIIQRETARINKYD
jgi:hypothetical protein